MNVEKDYEDLLGLLNKNRVRYCIVGAYALAVYSHPRYTKDLDILIEANRENAKRLPHRGCPDPLKETLMRGTDESFKRMRFKSLKLSEKDFIKKGRIIQLGYEPLRVDFLTSIEGVDFNDVWKGRTMRKYGRYKVAYIGRQQLITNKKAAARKQDRADLNHLLNE